jgi:hypothetical protein
VPWSGVASRAPATESEINGELGVAAATTQVDEIRRRMAQIRRDLHADVKDVVSSAEAVTDWRRYIRMYPWAALGMAVAVGYLIVPKRRVPSDVATEGDVARVREIVKEAKVEKKTARKGMIGAAFGFLVPIALRAAQGYAVQYLENFIQQQQAAAGRPPTEHPGHPDVSGGAGRPRGMTGL